MTVNSGATRAWLAMSDGPEDENSAGFTRPQNSQGREDDQARCSHFSVSVATLTVPGVFMPMQVPIYRCALAEVMTLRLRTTGEGRRLADSLEAQPLEGQPRLVCGPDLEAITTTTCTPDRCRRSCQPGFLQILAEIGVNAALPED